MFGSKVHAYYLSLHSGSSSHSQFPCFHQYCHKKDNLDHHSLHTSLHPHAVGFLAVGLAVGFLAVVLAVGLAVGFLVVTVLEVGFLDVGLDVDIFKVGFLVVGFVVGFDDVGV